MPSHIVDEERKAEKSRQREVQAVPVRQYVQRVVQDGRAPRHKEHQKLIKEEDLAVYYWSTNKDKNAFNNVLLLDKSRLKLKPGMIGDTDYIHASHVSNCDTRFILTQLPLKRTQIDFWRMVWQEGSRVIVCLIQPDEEMFYYWPEKRNKTLKLGFSVRFKLKNVDIRQSDEYDVHQVEVEAASAKGRKEKRTVHVLHYKKWARASLPSVHSALEFIELLWQMESMAEVTEQTQQSMSVDQENERPEVPTMVQCDSGVLRSGTFVAVSMLCKALRKRSKFDAIKTAMRVRKMRWGCLKSKPHYGFLYVSAFEFAAKNALLNREDVIYRNFVEATKRLTDDDDDEDRKKNRKNN